MITFDIETRDPELEAMGPGVYRKDGYVVGVAIKPSDAPAIYFPFRHPETTAEESRKNKAKVAEWLGTNEDKLAANSQYDWDWLANFESIPIHGTVHDIQIAEPLLDEYATSYSLDTLSRKYGREGKRETGLIEFCLRNGLPGNPKKHIWRMPASLVGPYAIGDVEETEQVFIAQKTALQNEDLYSLYEMECGLTPLLMQMRNIGIRVDREKRAVAASTLRKRINEMQTSLFKTYGAFNHNSTNQLAEVFDTLGLEYNRTGTGRPSIKKEDLERIDHPFAKEVHQLREVDKIYNSFVMGALVDYDVEGRIHCLFYPLKRDDGGTVSGRFSSQNPNLQQVPGKDEEEKGLFNFGKMVRGLLVPEENCWYGKIDYSQIEYRTIAHYARGPKSDEVKTLYKTNPKTDFHKLVQDWAAGFGFEIDRSDAKRINFGFAYFMGEASMARKFNWPADKAHALVDIYNKTMPFIKPTRTAVVNVAKGRGYIRTILGRKARVSAQIREDRREYIMFNRLIQGSAADINKKAMSDAYKAGIFNTLYPHLTVHDELGVSIPKTREGVDAFRELKNIMENAIHLRVPVIADAEVGPSWGECEDCDFEALYAQT